MKAITLHQPWASLIAAGYKQVETRSWPTTYRGPIVIHAGRTSPAEGMTAVDDALRAVSGQLLGTRVIDDLWRTVYPLGCIVAVADIVDCVRMTEETIAEAGPLERALGDWRVDRYAWELANVRPIEPIVVRGAQGIWGLDAATSAEVAGALAMGVH